MHKNIAFLGETSGLDLGKKAGETDISYFSRIDSRDIISIFSPKTYPEKIQSLLVAVGLADLVVLRVTELDWKLGEEIVVSNLLEKPGIILAEEWVYEQVKPLLTRTNLENWKYAKDEKEVWEFIRKWKPQARDGKEIWIDQAFKVKSVGTVVLGVVKAGDVTVHEKLVAWPSGKEAEIKSIQMQDKPYEKAGTNARVGLALKGIEPEDLPRGTIIGNAEVVTEIPSWEKLNLYKGDEKNITHIFNGISFVGTSNNKLVREIAVGFSKRFLLVENTNRKGLRIAGFGDFNV